MFYSVANPDILERRTVNALSRIVRVEEKVSARMTVDKSMGAQGAGASDANDAVLTLSALYEQFRRPIHSYVYRLLGSQEDADDVTQEVFVRACTSWNGLYERAHLSPWLYRIATNLCVDALRRRKRISWRSLSRRFRNSDHGEEEQSEDAAFFLSDNGGIPEVAEREHIRQALAGMPDEYAIVLVLSAAQGIPYQEVATIVGITPNAAATRISRAKRMFAEQYLRISKDGAKAWGGVR